MEKKPPYLVAIPLKGVVVDGSSVPNDLFDRHWTVVGQAAFESLALFHGSREASLYGNVNQIAQRLRPTGFLLVRYFEGMQKHVLDEYHAELVLAALSMTLLLTNAPKYCETPMLLSRARYPEVCDLPLTFFEDRIRSSGHTSHTGLIPLLDHHMTPKLSPSEIEAFVKNAPNIVQAVLSEPFVNHGAMQPLIDAMMATQGAWQNLTTGGFISSFMSACELLVDVGGPTDASLAVWQRRLDRMTVAIGIQRRQMLDRVAKARHQYVHRSVQPESDELSFSALAIAVQVWSVVNELYEQFKQSRTVELFLDSAYQNARAAEGGLPRFMDPSLVPKGHAANVEWMKRWLDSQSTLPG